MEQISLEKSKLLNKSKINLKEPIITQSIPQVLQSLDESNQNVANNGIVKDGGLTELYEQTVTVTTPEGDPFYTYIASNGAKVMLYSTNGGYEIDTFVQHENDAAPIYCGRTVDLFTKRRVIDKNYTDLVISSNGTSLIGIYYINTTVYIDELSIIDFSILNTHSYLVGISIINAKIAKANTLTYASILATSGYVVCDNTDLIYVLNDTSHTIISTLLCRAYTADNLSAVWNAGTVLIACPYNTTISNAGLYYNSVPGNYGAWSNFTFTATQGVVIAPTSNLLPAATTLIAQASTFSQTIPCYKITISALGALTGATLFNMTSGFNSSGTAANFKMESGVVTPWGCAGVYSTAGVAPFGSFQMWNYKDNNPNATKPIFVPDLTSYSGAVVLLTIGGLNSYPLAVNSFNQNISYYSINYFVTMPAVINDIGGSDFSTDIVAGNIFGGTKYNDCFIPPDYRSEASSDAVNGAGIIYRVNNGAFVYMQFARHSASLDFINIQEIGTGIVRLNVGVGNNKIIDTNIYQSYSDYSGFGMPYLFNYTNTASLAYCRAFNKYSSSLDYGLMKVDAAIANITATNIGFERYSGAQWNSVLWDGTAGAYDFNIGTITLAIPAGGGTTYSFNTIESGTYVFNQNIPPGNDAIYQGGGIGMPLSSAVQTPNYCGFMLANLLPGSQYQTFFILKGNFFTYDGNYIYSLPLSNGIGSALTAVPQPLVTARGLTFLDTSSDYAFFLDNFDNSVWSYNGARDINKALVFSQKGQIYDGWFNDYDNALYLKTESTIITVRDESSITENARPFNTYYTYNTQYGLYHVAANVVKLRTYKNLASSAIIPLIYQTGYLGHESPVMFTVSYIKGRIYCDGGLTSTLTMTYNWVTQDANGTDTSTITTTPQSTAKYFTFEWTPPHNNVLMFSLGITDASGTQKLVLLNLDAYTTYVNEANISNKVP